MSEHGHPSSELNDDSTVTHEFSTLGFHQPTRPPTSPRCGFNSNSTQSQEKANPIATAPTTVIQPPRKEWTPIPLRKWFAISLLSSMLVFAAAVEIALYYNQKQTGWRVPSVFTATTGVMHYVYTLPPVAIAMAIVTLWAWTDLDIKRLQPYVDLAYGNAPASTTLLLDYSNQHAALVSVFAYRHNHYLVALSSLMVLLGLALQPLAASLFTVKDIWWDAPDINVTSFEAPGLNPNFRNLSTFSSAAGFAEAGALYKIIPPNFVYSIWAIARLEIPSDQVANGTFYANTTSVRSLGHCAPADNVTLVSNPSGTVNLTGTQAGGCTATFPVAGGVTLEYGVDAAVCTASDAAHSPASDAAHSPAAFWVYTADAHAVVFCTPTVEVLDVSVEVALPTGDLKGAQVVRNSSGGSAMLTDGAGRAMNAVVFDPSGADAFAVQRATAAKMALAGAVVQLAQQAPGGLSGQIATQAPGGLSGQIATQGLAGITEGVYALYLSLVAKENYFVPNPTALNVRIKTNQLRLLLVVPTSHIGAGILILLFITGTLVHVLHHRTRDLVVMPHLPGTLAGAAAFTARSNLGDVLDGRLDAEGLERALQDKRFKIDRSTGRLVMDGA